MTTDAEVITQKYIRRYPDSRRTKSWAGRMVHIRTENGVWRVCGHGYTYAHEPDAWVLPFEDAQRQVAHCGPEKHAAFIAARTPSTDLVERLQPRWAFDEELSRAAAKRDTARPNATRGRSSALVPRLSDLPRDKCTTQRYAAPPECRTAARP